MWFWNLPGIMSLFILGFSMCMYSCTYAFCLPSITRVCICQFFHGHYSYYKLLFFFITKGSLLNGNVLLDPVPLTCKAILIVLLNYENMLKYKCIGSIENVRWKTFLFVLAHVMSCMLMCDLYHIEYFIGWHNYLTSSLSLAQFFLPVWLLPYHLLILSNYRAQV